MLTKVCGSPIGKNTNAYKILPGLHSGIIVGTISSEAFRGRLKC
jgi:hypothetical protein